MKHSTPLLHLKPFWLTLPLALYASGCVEVAPPDDAVISCNPDADDCPDGWTCRPNAEGENQCVDTSGTNADVDPPELEGTPLITPALGTDGTLFTVCFSVNERLSSDPVVNLNAGAGLIALEAAESKPEACADHQYAYQWTASADKASAGTHPLTVTLFDEDLNKADGLSLGTLSLDFAAPVLSSHSLSASVASAGLLVQLALNFNEAIEGQPQVAMESSEGTQLDWSQLSATDAQSFVFVYTPSGLEAEGTYNISVTAEDPAGNLHETNKLSSSLRLDFTSPVFTEPSILPASTVGPGQVVEVTFPIPSGTSFSALPTLTLMGENEDSMVTPPSFGAGSIDGTGILYTDTIRSSDCAGWTQTWDFVLSDGTDEAGNAMATQTFSDMLVVDCEAPTLTESCRYPAGSDSSGPCPDDSVARTYKLEDQITVTATFDEAISSGTFFMGTRETLSCGDEESIDEDCCVIHEAGTGFSCVQTVNPTFADGPHQWTASVTDQYNNGATVQLGAVTLDTSAPFVVNNTISPNPANASDTVVVTLTFSEPVHQVDFYADGLTVEAATAEGLAQTHIFTLTADPDGDPRDSFQLVVYAAEDAAGNAMASHEEIIGNLQWDTILPDLALSCLYPPGSLSGDPCPDASIERRYKEGDDIWVSFTMLEEGTAEVYLYGEPLPTCQEGADIVDCCAQDGQHVDCRRTVWLSDGEGSWDVTVTMVDTAGNGADTDLGTVHYDGIAPILLGRTITPNPANGTSSIEVAFSFSEDVKDVVLESDGFSFGEPTITGQTYVYAASSSNNTSGSFNLSVTATDEAGNALANGTVGTLEVDADFPQIAITNVWTTAGLTPPRVAFEDTLSFDLDTGGEDLASLDILFSGQSLSSACGPFQEVVEVDYRCSYTLPATGAGAGEENSVSLLVNGSDEAGNLTTASETFVVDDKPPEINSVQVSYSPANDNPLNTVSAMAVGTQATIVFLTNEVASISCPDCDTAVWADCGERTFTFTPLGTTNGALLFRFDYTLSENANGFTGPVEMNCPMFVRNLEDQVGNRVDELLLENVRPDGVVNSDILAVDTKGPEMSAIDINQLKHLRVPWGATQTQGVASQYVVPSSVNADASLDDAILSSSVFLDDSVSALFVYSTEASLEPSGTLYADQPISSLADVDATMAWVSAIDAAGNASSSRALIQQVEWVATLGGKVTGSTIENPHRVFSSSTPVSGPVNAKWHETDADVFYTQNEGIGITQAHQEWFLLQANEYPQAQTSGQLVYDTARSRAVYFGGSQSGFGYRGRTWEWDSENWYLVKDESPLGEEAPEPRQNHAMAFDTRRQRVILFGGQIVGDNQTEDTWEWDGISWERRHPGDAEGVTAPKGRYGHRMAFDPIRGETLLFGGRTSSGFVNDLWAWDGDRWQQLNASDWQATDIPSPRYWHEMVYDRSRSKLVLFGGRTSTIGAGQNDTWEWDGSVWHQIEPATQAPPERYSFGMAYDSTRQTVLVFGGAPWNAGDLWEWNGADWSVVSNADPLFRQTPTYRQMHQLAYDVSREQLLLVGGKSGESTCLSFMDRPLPECPDTWTWGSENETWRLDGVDGSVRGVSLPQLSKAAAFYVSELNRTYLYGGGNGISGQDDLYYWDGAQWLNTNPSGDLPGSLFSMAMSPTSDLTVGLLFGGASNSGNTGNAWSFNAAFDSHTWIKLNDTDPLGETTPSPRVFPAMAYDEDRKVVVLFGGTYTDAVPTILLGDTWEWSSTTQWTFKRAADPLGATTPSARSGHTLTYDPIRQRTVLFGGNDEDGPCAEYWGCGDTWTWDGTNWLEVIGEDPLGVLAPLPRSGHRAVFDKKNQVIVLFGGTDADGVELDDLWIWNGAQWTHISQEPASTFRAPEARANHILIYDEFREEIILAGGEVTQTSNDTVFDQTWQMPLHTSPQPGYLFEINYREAQGAASMDCIGVGQTCAIESVQFMASAGGEGSPTDEHGAALFVWNGVTFSQEATNNGATGANEQAFFDQDSALRTLNAAFMTPEDIGNLFYGDSEHIFIMIAPKDTDDKDYGQASVAVDYMEVRVRYRHPDPEAASEADGGIVDGGPDGGI